MDEIPKAWGEKYRERIERLGGPDGDACCICARKLSAKGATWMVHLDSSGNIIEADATPEDDMYWFGIGNECAKSVPLHLRAKAGSLPG